jgi:spermidine synthase
LFCLAKEISAFNKITIYESNELYGEMGKFRFLQFADDSIQGAMDMRDLKRVVLVYQRAILHLMESNHSSFDKVFVIGHGIGSIAGHYPDKSFRVAELDEKIVDLSRQFFGYSMDNVSIGDGRAILEQEQQNTYDYLILDAFTHKGTPLHFTTLEFFRLTKDKLNSHGAILMNLMGRAKSDPFINAIHSTVRESYKYTKVFSLPAENEKDRRNIIIMASHRTIDYEARELAGFFEIELEQGHLMLD